MNWKNKQPYLLLGLTFIGFLDATYLTIRHYTTFSLPCTFKGCEIVLNSPYATVWNLPIAAIGAAYYLSMILLTILYIDSGNRRWLKYLVKISLCGLLVSAYLVFLQIFIIKAICMYCGLSVVVTVAVFIVGALLLNQSPKQINPQSNDGPNNN